MAMDGNRPADAFVEWLKDEGYVTSVDQETVTRAMWRKFCELFVSELATNAQLRSAVVAAGIHVTVTTPSGPGTGATDATGTATGGIQ